MKKSIGVISQLPRMASYYGQFLRELFGDIADIYEYSLEDGTIRELRRCDLYFSSCTSYEIMRNSWARDHFPPDELIVQSAVTFTRPAVELLKSYPDGTHAMLVNQNRHMALECISQLYHFGITNIEFIPYAPDMGAVPDVDLAFVLGPSELGETDIPVVDLGLRRPTANTICEVALKLGISTFLESPKFTAYTAELASVDYSLQKISYDNLTMENKLELILNALDDGIICVDAAGKVTMINRAAQGLLGLSCQNVLGQTASHVLPELSFAISRSQEPRLINIRGQELSVTVSPLRIREQTLGTFAVLRQFEKEEDRQIGLRMQKVHKVHHARYTFADIAGSSPAIEKARDIARRMADNNASVMIEGESGTGKELFAQAIHSASPRKDKPFIAVNCAALTETLLESELFGYVDGAFTGAKKGGKQGLFEYAHQGTLFLDEIETMSPSLQAKLLRVLQEREVVRIGSVEPIPINVRVISSTNEDLFRRVQENTFRRDLYYRLNVIPLHLPALRERREDILLLVETFCHSFGAEFTLSARAQAALLQHRWPGNVRELRNCVEYLQHMGRSFVDLEDLPEQFHPRRPLAAAIIPEAPAYGDLLPQEWRVMEVLGDLYRQRRGIGRQGIVHACAQRGFAISEHEVRLALQTLTDHGWLVSSRGRGGTQLSEDGYQRYLEFSGQK